MNAELSRNPEPSVEARLKELEDALRGQKRSRPHKAGALVLGLLLFLVGFLMRGWTGAGDGMATIAPSPFKRQALAKLLEQNSKLNQTLMQSTSRAFDSFGDSIEEQGERLAEVEERHNALVRALEGGKIPSSAELTHYLVPSR